MSIHLVYKHPSSLTPQRPLIQDPHESSQRRGSSLSCVEEFSNERCHGVCSPIIFLSFGFLYKAIYSICDLAQEYPGPDYTWKDTELSISQFSVISLSLKKSLSVLELHEVCKKVANGRPFNLIYNNCQDFCLEVLEKLGDQGFVDYDEAVRMMKDVNFTTLAQRITAFTSFNVTSRKIGRAHV